MKVLNTRNCKFLTNFDDIRGFINPVQSKAIVDNDPLYPLLCKTVPVIFKGVHMPLNFYKHQGDVWVTPYGSKVISWGAQSIAIISKSIVQINSNYNYKTIHEALSLDDTDDSNNVWEKFGIACIQDTRFSYSFNFDEVDEEYDGEFIPILAYMGYKEFPGKQISDEDVFTHGLRILPDTYDVWETIRLFYQLSSRCMGCNGSNWYKKLSLLKFLKDNFVTNGIDSLINLAKDSKK